MIYRLLSLQYTKILLGCKRLQTFVTESKRKQALNTRITFEGCRIFALSKQTTVFDDTYNEPAQGRKKTHYIMNNLNKVKLQAIRRDMEIALEAIGKDHGITFEVGNMTFSSAEFTAKIEAKVHPKQVYVSCDAVFNCRVRTCILPHRSAV